MNRSILDHEMSFKSSITAGFQRTSLVTAFNKLLQQCSAFVEQHFEPCVTSLSSTLSVFTEVHTCVLAGYSHTGQRSNASEFLHCGHGFVLGEHKLAMCWLCHQFLNSQSSSIMHPDYPLKEDPRFSGG